MIYFDTAATALKPQEVIDAIADFYKNHYGTVHRGIYRRSVEATERYNQVREKVAHFLGAQPDQIVFTKGTTDSINLVAATFPLKPGDEVVITELEHHSNIVPWQLACERTGATLKVIRAKEGELILEPFSPKTKIVAIAHVSNSTGVQHPVEKVIAMAREVGAAVLIDGAQSAPHMPIDVKKLDCDFFACSGHKLYGPTGIGILYGKNLDALPPYQGGGDMIDRVTLEKTTYAKPPLRFEAGTPNIAGVIGLGAAIDYLTNIGMEKVYEHDQKLLNYALPKLQEIPGLKVLGNPTSSIISFVIEGTHPLDIGTLLDVKGIAIRTGHLCAQPTMDHFGITSTCRISFGIENAEEEIDQFLVELGNALIKL